MTLPPLFAMVTAPFWAVIFCKDASPDVVFVIFISLLALVKEEPVFCVIPSAAVISILFWTRLSAVLFIVRLPAEFIFKEFAPVMFPTVIFAGTGAVVESFTSPFAVIVPKLTFAPGLSTVILLPVMVTVPPELSCRALSASPMSPLAALSVMSLPASRALSAIVWVILPFVAVAVIEPDSVLISSFIAILSPLRVILPCESMF